MPIRSINDLRKQVGPDWNDVSDEDLISSYAQSIKADPAAVAYQLGFGLEEGGKNSKRLSSSVDRYQAGLYGFGEELTKAVGLDSASEFLGKQRRANELRADTDSLRAQQLGAVDSFKDVKNLSDFGDYAVGLGIQSLPYVGESLVGGIAARGLMGGTRAALRAAEATGDVAAATKAKRALDIGSTAGGTAASYPSAVGDILSNQREQAGQTDPLSAFGLAIPYAAANAVGLEGAAARSSLFRNSINLLDKPGGLTGAAVRATATGVSTGLKEGASETFQEGMNQLGRMAVDPTESFLSDAAQERFKESFIGGAVLGGGTASALGGWRRSQPVNDIQQVFQDTSTGTTPAPAITQTTSPATVAPPPAVPAAPAVSGGTTAVAQAAQAAQADQAQVEQKLEQQAAREQVFEEFGIANPQDPTKGQFFGQKLFGPAVGQVADAMAAATQQMTPIQRELARAVTFANAETGNQLVRFAFNAADPGKSVAKALESVSKVLTKFQIGHVQTAQEAGQILNTLSESAKGQQLEQINALHVALTGEDTTGFLEVQNATTAKGAKDGKLQVPNPAGVGTVREQGAAGSAAQGNDGDVRPGGVQPVNAGSVPEGSLGLQVGQLPGEGVRPGTGAEPVAVDGVAVPAQAPQVTGAPDGQTATAPASSAGQAAAVQPAGGGAAQAGVSEAAGVSGQVPETEEVTSQLEDIVQEVMRLLIKPTSRMDEATARKQRDFVFTILMNGPYDSLAVMAADFGITPSQAKDWSAKAGKIKEDPAQLAAAFKAVAEQRGTSVEDLMAEAQSRTTVATEEAVLPDGSQGTSRTEDVLESDEAAFDEEGGEVSDREINDEGLVVKGRKSGESLQERFNEVETNQAKFLRLSEQLAKAEDEGDQEAVDRLNAELDAVLAKGIKQSDKRTKRTTPKAEKPKSEPKAKKQATPQEQLDDDKRAAQEAEAAKLRAEIAAKTREERKGLEVGDTVVNPKLGTGVVVSFAGNGASTTVTVKFQSGQTKELSVAAAKLEKVTAGQQSDNQTRKEAAARVARANAQSAFADRNRYRDLQDAINAHEENVVDTLSENGETDPAIVDHARTAYQKEVERLRAEEVSTPQEQYETVTKGFPVPAWGDLTQKQRDQLSDLANRDQLNLAAVNTVMGGVAENVERKSDSEKIFELQRTRPEPKKGDVIRFNLPWVPGGYEVEAVVGGSIYADEFGREVPKDAPGAQRFVTLTYKVDGQQITNDFSPETLRLNTLGNIAAPKLYNVDRLTSEPSVYADEDQRTPSLSRGIATLRRMFDAGKITAEQFVARVEALYDQVQDAKMRKPVPGRVRGADYIRQKLLEAKRRGYLSEKAVDMAEWFILQNPTLVDDLGISLTNKKDGASGQYEAFTRIMTLMKGSANDETTVHEILHHLERMMPAPMQAAIRKSWLKSMLRASQTAETPAQKLYYAALMDFHFRDGFVDLDRLAPALRELYFTSLRRMGIDGTRVSGQQLAQHLLKTAQVGYEHYQHFNPSEFWAVNGSRILQGRFDVSASMVGKIKQWLKEFIEKAKAVLGFQSDAAVIRALNGALKGNGQFISGQRMLMEGVDYNMFAGQSAQSKPQAVSTLDEALEMEDQGSGPEAIWYVTGWGRGPDGRWRFEIDDSQAKFKKDFTQLPERQLFDSKYQPERLEDILDHPSLFEAYPELRDVKFAKSKAFMDVFKGTQGWFDDTKNEVVVTPYAQDPLSTLLHEIQHWVQDKEGFAPGGNPDATRLDNKEALTKLSKMLTEVQAEASGTARSVAGKGMAASVNDLLTDPQIADKVSAAYQAHDDAVEQLADARRDAQAAKDAADAAYEQALDKYEAEKQRLEDERAKLYNEQFRSGLSYKDPRYKELDKLMEANRAARVKLPYPSPFDKKWKEPILRAEAFVGVMQKRADAKAKVLKQVLNDNVTDADTIQYYMYKMIAGEAEARNTQTRRNMSETERRSFSPEVTVDIPSDLQVVTRLGGPKASVLENIERLPQPLQAPTRAVTTNTWAGVKKAGLALAITEDVVKLAQKTMKSAADYLRAQYAQQATRLQFELQVEKILQQYDKLPKNLQGTGEGSVNKLIFDMTSEGKWGFTPSYNANVKVDPEMKRRFDAVKAQSPAAAKLVQDVFEHGHNALLAKQGAVKAAADKVFAERVAAAQGDKAELAEIALERKAFDAKFERILKIKDNKPYAYLGRYGNYVAVAKSNEFMEAEDLSAKGDLDATKWLKENESNADHYMVSFAETQADADRIAAEWKGSGKFGQTYSSEKMDSSAYIGGGDLFLAFKRMENMVTRKAKGELVSGTVLDGMRKLMAEMYLASVAESSAHTSSLARKNIAGADMDMMRNLATRGRADAHFLAALKHGDDVTDAMDRMIDERKENPRESTPVLNELLKRQAQSMEYKLPGTLAQNLTQLSTVYYLSTSPAFYVQQLLQTAVLSLPFMAGRLGYFRSVRAIQQAYGDVRGLVKGLGVNDHVDFDKAPADVRAMLQTLVGMGKIDIGIDADAKARTSDQGVMSKVMRKLQGVNTRIETINRATAAIAAYRGYKQKNPGASDAAAVQYAADVVSNTHGSYDGFNTPRALSSDVGRVVGQFKRFQIIQLSMLGKLLHTAFKGASPDEKMVARASLRFITAHMAVLGGALGVPFVSQIGNILLGIFGDDDEPKDLEQTLRDLIGDEAVATLLLRGVPASVGLESLGKKVSMENVASLLPFTDVSLADRDALTKVYVALLGPSAALSLKMADGLGMMRKGEVYKGMEMLLPNGIGNAMKGYRFAEEGVTMRNGDTVMGPEEISMVDAAFQAIGLPTNTISDRQRAQTVVAEANKFYEDRAAQLKRDYVRAFRDGDSGAMQDAREAWMEMQDARSRNGFSRQPLSTLFRAPMEQQKRERNTVGGVQFNRNNRPFVENVVQ